MNILDILIITFTIVLVYLIIPKKSPEDFEKNNIIAAESSQNNDEDDAYKYVDIILKSKNKPKLNKHFIEMQSHQDYSDTISAFELITTNKQLFNLGEIPVTTITEPSSSEVKLLIKKFIKEINKTVKNHVSNDHMKNGWNMNVTEEQSESGWEKQQKELGLMPSIYLKPAEKAPIKLIKLDHLQKFETDDQIKYESYLIIKKPNVRDQLVIQVNFVIDKRDLNLDREFFDKKKDNYETSVQIENVFVLGFMTNSSIGKKSSKEKFYDFGHITDGKMFSQQDIMKVLNQKRKNYEMELAGL